MSIFGNIAWIILGGIFIFLYYLCGGLFFCITVIGIPFGLQCFKLAGLALFPFGRSVGNKERGTGALSVIMNILWLLFFGLEIALMHLAFAFLTGITIIGLPLARQHIKMIALALGPFGKEIK